MRDYELTVLIAPEGEKEVDKEVKTLQTLLTKAGAKIKSKVDPVRKAMAYEIRKFREAYYLFMELSLDPGMARGVEDKLKLEDEIIRYLLINKA